MREKSQSITTVSWLLLALFLFVVSIFVSFFWRYQWQEQSVYNAGRLILAVLAFFVLFALAVFVDSKTSYASSKNGNVRWHASEVAGFIYAFFVGNAYAGALMKLYGTHHTMNLTTGVLAFGALPFTVLSAFGCAYLAGKMERTIRKSDTG